MKKRTGKIVFFKADKDHPGHWDCMISCGLDMYRAASEGSKGVLPSEGMLVQFETTEDIMGVRAVNLQPTKDGMPMRSYKVKLTRSELELAIRPLDKLGLDEAEFEITEYKGETRINLIDDEIKNNDPIDIG